MYKQIERIIVVMSLRMYKQIKRKTVYIHGQADAEKENIYACTNGHIDLMKDMENGKTDGKKDTKRCWSLGKLNNCNVRGCGRGHNYLLHDVLQNEEAMMVSAMPGQTGGRESSLRCRQMVAAENEGQCFRLNVLYPLIIVRLNTLVSKYGLSREYVHFRQVLETHLPLIIDIKLDQDIEDDLAQTSHKFRGAIQKFLKNKKKAKLNYPDKKSYDFALHELVMRKEYTPSTPLRTKGRMWIWIWIRIRTSD